MIFLTRTLPLRSASRIGIGILHPSMHIFVISTEVPSEILWPWLTKIGLVASFVHLRATPHSLPSWSIRVYVSPGFSSSTSQASRHSYFVIPSTSKKLLATPIVGISNFIPRLVALPRTLVCCTPCPSTNMTCGLNSGAYSKRLL